MQNYGDSKKRGDCQVLGEGRNEQMGHIGVSGRCNETVMMDTCHYTFIQTHRVNRKLQAFCGYDVSV